MAGILVIPLSVCCHIHSCVVLRYWAQCHCLFTAYFGTVSRGLASWGPRTEGRGEQSWYTTRWCTKILIYRKQQIFSHRIEGAVSLKSLPLNIGPDGDPVCPTSSFFINIVIESSWVGAIWRPRRIRRGGAKLPCARLCACWLFWHPAFTEIHR